MKFVVQGILNKNRAICFRKQNYIVAKTHLYTLPSAFVEESESLEDALEQEFFEDLGLVVQAEKLIFAEQLKGNPETRIFTFQCKLIKENISVFERSKFSFRKLKRNFFKFLPEYCKRPLILQKDSDNNLKFYSRKHK